MKKIIFIFSIPLILTSCISKKSIVYLNGISESMPTSNNYTPLIQKDDILYIKVTSAEPKAVEPYNLDTSNSGPVTTQDKYTYLVDSSGAINFASIGLVNVANKTVNDVKNIIQNRLKDYVSDAVVNIRIMNFKVSVLGEVNKPGIVNVPGQRITLLEALASSGDLTLFGRRDNILIMRESKGVKTTAYIDITKPDFINSEYYYLDQNDVVYVEPNKKKIDSTAIGTNVLTVTQLLVSIVGIITTTYLINK
jgi:polysaccharide biosynthesis/export protein